MHGDGVGKTLGYPTANINVPADKTHLKDGVYAATATYEGKQYHSGLVIRRDVDKVEVHLLDYTGDDFYGAYLSVEPIQQVSQMETYTSQEALKKKIAEDIRLIEEMRI